MERKSGAITRLGRLWYYLVVVLSSSREMNEVLRVTIITRRVAFMDEWMVDTW